MWKLAASKIHALSKPSAKLELKSARLLHYNECSARSQTWLISELEDLDQRNAIKNYVSRTFGAVEINSLDSCFSEGRWLQF